MSIRRSGWLCLFCLSVVSGLAQQNGPAAAAAAAGANRRITLDVVVTDKSGKPVSGLQQEDFALLDNKQPLTIASFQAVDGAAADQPAEVILVVDDLNTPYVRQVYAREQIEKFLRQYGAKLPFPVSLVFVSASGASFGDPPSRDGNAVIAALSQKKPGVRTDTAAQGFHGDLERQQSSLDALWKLMSHEKTGPGRKLVVWISPGWLVLTGGNVVVNSTNQQGLFDSIVTFADELRRARMTLYEVDPTGAAEAAGRQVSQSRKAYGVMDGPGLQATRYKEFVKGVKKADQVKIEDLALPVLVEQTGGQVFNTGSGGAGEIATCAADANAYYAISFESPAGEGPHEYHALAVKLGKPGLTARTRTGYYSRPAR
jgi:VWFA-related protein